MKKTIVIFSNPFGYGPTGNAIPVLRSFLSSLNNTELVFAGSGLCLEIVSHVSTNIICLDERDEVEIEKYLRSLENPYVVGFQNRFCIRVANRIGIPCAFIDILAWFWKEIPDDHLLADEIFWIKFPKIEKKIPLDVCNIHLVQSIIPTALPSAMERRQLTIHIGGAKYPPMEGLPVYYLNLVAKALNLLRPGYNFKKIFCAGGSEAMDYLLERVTNKNITLVPPQQEKFINEIEKSSHMLTTAGVSSTLESFSLNVPTSFLLPLNLAHLALTDILKECGACTQYMEWSNYVNVSDNLRSMNEKEALVEINDYARLVDADEELSSKFVDDFLKMAYSIPDNKEQKELIMYMGTSGADEIVEILTEKWQLS